MLVNLAKHNPIVVHFFLTATTFLLSLTRLCVNSGLSLDFCLVVHQPHDAGTNTNPRLCNPFLCSKIETLEDPNDLVQVPFKKYLHGCRRMARRLLLPWILLFFDTLLPLWHGWLWKCGGSVFWFLQWSPYEHWPFFFPLVTSTFTSFNAGWSLSSLDHCSCQSFVIEVSDLYSSSPLFSTFENWASISSDESPCRTIPTVFWVDQTHVSSTCTDFPRCYRMDSLTKNNNTSSCIEVLNIIIAKNNKE